MPISYGFPRYFVAVLLLGYPLFASAQGNTILLKDTFDKENGGAGQLSYMRLEQWNVTKGSVDLIGKRSYDFYPRHGLYLDLDGTTSQAGTLESKKEFNLAAGTYELRFDLGNNPGHSSPNTMEVRLGTAYKESFTRQGKVPLKTVIRTFSVATPTSGSLIFEHAGGDNGGLVLDNVRLTQLAPKSSKAGTRN
jgi:hypothetical protein